MIRITRRERQILKLVGVTVPTRAGITEDEFGRIRVAWHNRYMGMTELRVLTGDKLRAYRSLVREPQRLRLRRSRPSSRALDCGRTSGYPKTKLREVGANMKKLKDPAGAAAKAYCELRHEEDDIGGRCDGKGKCENCRKAVAVIIRAYNEEMMTK